MGEQSVKAWKVVGNARRLCPWNTRGRERRSGLRCGGRPGGRLDQRGMALGAVGRGLGDSGYSGRTLSDVSRVTWSDSYVWRMDWKKQEWKQSDQLGDNKSGMREMMVVWVRMIPTKVEVDGLG